MGKKSRMKKERRALAQQMAAAEAWARKNLCGHTNSASGKRCLEPAAFEILTTGHSPVLGEKPGEMKVEPSLVRACDLHAKQMRKLGMVSTCRSLNGNDVDPGVLGKALQKLDVQRRSAEVSRDVETAPKPPESVAEGVEKF